jgi:hypothetical protein
MPGYGRSTTTRTRTWGTPRRMTQDPGTLAVSGMICAIVGFFTFGLVLGPIAILCGWLAMGRRWRRGQPIPVLIAVVLGAIDTLFALIWLAGSQPSGGGWLF